MSDYVSFPYGSKGHHTVDGLIKIDRGARGPHMRNPVFVYEFLNLGPAWNRCIDVNDVRRKRHDLDKDDRCIFCNWLRPEKLDKLRFETRERG